MPKQILATLVASACLLPSLPAVGDQLVPPPGLKGYLADKATSADYAAEVLHYLNELSARRRLTTVFPNEQSPFYGVQMNHVNVGRGNLTFLVRDLVRQDRVPIVFGRVYDSSKTDELDFGRGWKLSVSEFLYSSGRGLRYVDSSNSEYELRTDGLNIWSEFPHLTGIARGSLGGSEAVLQIGNLTKTFQRFEDGYRLVEVHDSFGNWVRLSYTGRVVDRISSSGGRYVDIERDAADRIVSATDDAQRSVRYTYDGLGRLSEAHDMAAEISLYAYDGRSLLTEVVDPRDVVIIAARYDESGRIAELTSQHDTMTFDHGGSSTLVTNAMQQAARFWHHETGLTETVQDFAGAVSTVVFDRELRVDQLLFQGAAVATARYRAGRLSGVISQGEDGAKTRGLVYDGRGRLIQISESGKPLARYSYDEQGNVMMASDSAGQRHYRYSPNGDLTSADMNRFRVMLRTNGFGLTDRISWELESDTSHGHSTAEAGASGTAPRPRVRALLAVSYDDVGRIQSFRFNSPKNAPVSEYRYTPRGFRQSGRYSLLQDASEDEVSLTYDAVGNLVEWAYPAPGGEVHRVRHTVGPQNQALAVTPLGRETLEQVIEYDANGRPVRVVEGGRRELTFTYDDLGRLTDVHLNREHVLTTSHGPMDVDPVHESDAHSPFTTIDRPIASAVFGSLDEIAFSRPVGVPYGFVRFEPTMARFIIAAPLIPAPDAVTFASLRRRNLASATTLDPMPMHGLDKPSNSSFIPPEYFAVNCFVCQGSTWGFDLSRYGSGVVAPGQVVTFVADSSYNSACYHTEYYEDAGWVYFPHPFSHVIYVNGSYVTTHYSSGYEDWDWWTHLNGEYLEFPLSFSTPGTNTVEDILRCEAGCTNNIFLAQAQEAVEVCDPEDAAYDDAYSRFWGPRASLYQTRYNFADLGNTFSFSTRPGSDVASLQSDVEASHSAWNITKANACGNTFNIFAGATWSAPDSRNLIYATAASLDGDCARRSTTQINGADYDLVRVLSSLPGDCGPRAEVFAHELGHVLGFSDSSPSFTSDIMKAPRVGLRSVEVHHAQVLLARY